MRLWRGRRGVGSKDRMVFFELSVTEDVNAHHDHYRLPFQKKKKGGGACV